MVAPFSHALRWRHRMRVTGRVKWFNDTKGYGLIHPDRGEDVVVRSTSIQGQGFKSLEQAQAVEVEVVQGPHGPQADRAVGLGRPMALGEKTRSRPGRRSITARPV